MCLLIAGRQRLCSDTGTGAKAQRKFSASTVLLGRGEAIFEGLDLPALGYWLMESTATDLATYVVLGREASE
jgi:hypothetical protein